MDRQKILLALNQNRDAVQERFHLSEEDLEKTYAPGKWPVRVILAHLADCEYVNLWRFIKAIAEPGSNVETFDENRWVTGLDYLSRPLQLSREQFLTSRRVLMHYVESFSHQSLSHHCVHPEKGEVTGWRWAELIVQHAEHHLGQIDAAVAGREWRAAEVAGAWQFRGAGK